MRLFRILRTPLPIPLWVVASFVFCFVMALRTLSDAVETCKGLADQRDYYRNALKEHGEHLDKWLLDLKTEREAREAAKARP